MILAIGHSTPGAAVFCEYVFPLTTLLDSGSELYKKR